MSSGRKICLGGLLDFVTNLVLDVVERKAALLTDSRPQLQVVSTNEHVNDRPDILEALEHILRGLWDQLSWSEELARGLAFAEVVGSSPAMIHWDPLGEGGRGEIRPRFWDTRFFVMDPAVIAAADLQDAEFCGTEEVRTKASLIEQFGQRAWYCRPDGELSSFPQSSGSRGLQSPAGGEQFRRRPLHRVQSQIPRVKCKQFWFKDWRRDQTGRPVFFGAQGRPAPRIIRHVVIAGGEVLVDEPNPYWHGQYPYELFDWGLELDNPFGQSEVQKLRKSQEAFNKLASQILKNTNLMNNFKVVADSNALDPEQWDRLSNRAAYILRKRQGTTVDFQSPPALPGYLFQLLQFLVKSMEMISGLGDVTRGTANPSQSGIAIEGLAVASQTILRLQARRLEAFITRLWSKAIPLVFQYYKTNRVVRLVGASDRLTTFLFDRAALFSGDVKPEDIFRDFVLHIQPGSSLAVAKIQKAMLMMNLHRAGLVPGVEVLRAAEIKDPETTFEKAQAEQAEHAQQMPQGRGRSGSGGRGANPAGLGKALGGNKRVPAQFPASGPTA